MADRDRRPRSSSPKWLPAAVFAAFASGFGGVATFWLQTHKMPVTYDAGNYQYYSGYAEIHGFSSAIALPGQLQTYLDPQLNVGYYLLIAHLSPRLAVEAIGLLQTLPGAVLALLVWHVARSVTRSHVVPLLAGLLAGAGAFLSPIHVLTLGQTSSDALLSLLPIVALALLFSAIGGQDTPARRSYVLAAVAGLLLGVAADLKLTEAAYGVGILIGFGAAVLVARPRANWRLRRCIVMVAIPAATACIVAAALYVPEALILWHRYRDPFFPYFNGIFHSPYLLHGSYNPGCNVGARCHFSYAAHNLGSLWRHFVQLLVSGPHGQNQMSSLPIKSPVLFFAIIVTAGFLVADLIKRDKPAAVLVEVSFLASFVMWAVVFGFYRYLAPLEIAATAAVLALVFLHRLHRLVILGLLAVAVVLGTEASVRSSIGNVVPWSNTYFAVPAGAFADLKGAGVVMADNAPLGFIVPFLPADTDIVRAGGNLELVVDRAWWTHVAGIVQQSHRSWWVVFGTTSPDRVVRFDLGLIGLPSSFGDCHLVITAVTKIDVCRVAPVG